jgi:hypothetical protein
MIKTPKQKDCNLQDLIIKYVVQYAIFTFNIVLMQTPADEAYWDWNMLLNNLKYKLQLCSHWYLSVTEQQWKSK